MELHNLQILFDIGKVEYYTVLKLSKKSGSKYLNRFRKKNLEEVDFDEFIVENRLGLSYDTTTQQILEDLGIELPDDKTFWSVEQIAEYRKTNRKFGRNITLISLKTWD